MPFAVAVYQVRMLSYLLHFPLLSNVFLTCDSIILQTMGMEETISG